VANILGKIGSILKVDADPSAGAGTPSPVNTLAEFGAVIYVKTGVLDTNWTASSSTGTVTSVDLTAPASILSVSGNPVTTSGTLALALVNQAANLVWAGPAAGGPADPTFRALVSADLPFSATLATKSGTVAGATFAGVPRKATVTFGTAFVSTAYSITITGENSRSWTYESKAAGGFVINANSGAAVAGEVSWQAIFTGETS